MGESDGRTDIKHGGNGVGKVWIGEGERCRMRWRKGEVEGGRDEGRDGWME